MGSLLPRPSFLGVSAAGGLGNPVVEIVEASVGLARSADTDPLGADTGVGTVSERETGGIVGADDAGEAATDSRGARLG